MRVSRILLIVAVALPLGACLTATAEDFERHDDGVCRDMGLKRGTQAYADCRQNVSSQRQMAARIGMQNQMWSLQGR
jgi:hypothetical protein